jgi:hypothetical protein
MVQTETQPHELWMVSYVLVEHSSADPDDSLWREHLAICRRATDGGSW